MCPFSSKAENPQGKFYNRARPDFHCTSCGCNIESKTHDLPQYCPEGRWQAVTNREDADKINQILKNQ